jgi:hypothetical protein
MVKKHEPRFAGLVFFSIDVEVYAERGRPFDREEG